MSDNEAAAARRGGLDLFLISVLGLFLELVLIRWLASEIRVFAYFKNFPLFAAFIGLGLGCYVADRRPIRWWLAAAALTSISLIAALSTRLHLADIFFPDPSLFYFRGSIISPNIAAQIPTYPLLGGLADKMSHGWLLLLIGAVSFGVIAFLFIVAAVVFYPLGQETGRLFRGRPPLAAYSINVGGALVGSAAFTLASYLEIGPRGWLLPNFALLAYFCWVRKSRVGLGLTVGGAVALAVMLSLPGEPGEIKVWSPYYRISLTPGIPEDPTQGWSLRVNHDYFQRAADLTPAAVAKSPQTLEMLARNYNLPYRLAARLDRVLVVGAGMGNDVSAALRSGAGKVTAVDIDPAIIRLGRQLHPEHPYASDRVEVVVNDARAFFRRNAYAPGARRYNLVVFGLLDSQTALTSMSSVRLEFYVYTMESLREALQLVDPKDGMVVITFSVGWRTWIGQRIYSTLAEAWGSPPLALIVGDGYDGGVTFVAGPGLAGLDRSRLADFSAKDVTADYAGSPVRKCRDDWPFLYINPEHWPWVYMIALVLLLGVGGLIVARSMKFLEQEVGKGGRRVDLHMMLMGTAFMLVETGAIARLSLLFGATWIVTAAVILAVMVMILGANALAGLNKAPSTTVCYVLLLVSLVAVYFTPFDAFLAVTGGRVLATAILALPVLFASLVFAEAFKTTLNSHLALGCNMLGAILGGVLEALSLSVGIKALALIAALIYGLSAVALNAERRGRTAPEAGDAK